MTRPLTCVVAGAGFGKTTLLAAWAERSGAAWYSARPSDVNWAFFGRGLAGALSRVLPGFMAAVSAGLDAAGPEAAAEGDLRPGAWGALVCEALAGLEHDIALVIDDVHEIGSGHSAQLLESLCRLAPPRLHLVLTSRTDLPFPIDRMRGRGQVLELGGRDLAFSPPELADLLRSWVGPEADDVADAVWKATGGWPAAARLGAEALSGRDAADRHAVVAALHSHHGPVFSYLAAEALAAEPPEVTALVRTAARLDRFTVSTCEALELANAPVTIASLLHRGLFIERHPGEDWLSLYPLVRDFARERLPMGPSEERALHRRAATWFEAAGSPVDTLRELSLCDDDDALADAVIRYGPNLVLTAQVDAVLGVAGRLRGRSTEVDSVLGQALQVSGDWEGALACFRRASDARPDLDSTLAWRLGLIHYLRGDVDEAQATFERARLDGRHPSDDVLVLAWLASIDFLRGDQPACEAHAAQALDIATQTEDPRGRAAAHTVLAMLAALVGDRAATRAHDHAALENATRAGDVLQLIRIRSNRGVHAGEEGSYQEALVEFEAGIRLSEVSGFAALRAHILANRGETLFHLGHLDQAATDLHDARLIYERMGSRRLCLPLAQLGDVHSERGDPIAARACYEEALTLAERSPDHQIVVAALAGLARLLADQDPAEARRLVKRALDFGPGPSRALALLAAGHVALALDERERAAELAVEAGAQARAQRNRAAMAEALELEGAAVGDDTAVAKLEAAIGVWTEVGNPLGMARAQLALARMLGGRDGRRLALHARSSLRALGARRYERLADDVLAALDRAAVAAVAVQTLGVFGVFRDGAPVAITEWQSRKARDLLKVLIARRGRAVPRETIMELLWPGDDPVAVSNRLSGALVTLRGVLDPGRRFPNDHFVVADKQSIRLERSRVDVDVERFLSEAAAGLARAPDAVDLSSVEAAYAGDFLEEDPYEDWAAPLRDEARAAYLALARSLAAEASGRGDDEAATRFYLRILGREPYDAPAHEGLIATHARAGRHGEAARAFRVYRARMQELGVEVDTIVRHVAPPARYRPADIPPSSHPHA